MIKRIAAKRNDQNRPNSRQKPTLGSSIMNAKNSMAKKARNAMLSAARLLTAAI